YFLFALASTAEFKPLPLHAALPISAAERGHRPEDGRHPARKRHGIDHHVALADAGVHVLGRAEAVPLHAVGDQHERATAWRRLRSEEHTSELQSREKLVCRLLLEKK